MKRVNVQALLQYVERCNCIITNISEPISFNNSNVTLTCSCTSKFLMSIKQITRYRVRKSVISCGCIDKKWTNERIDSSVIGRSITRVTNCNVNGFQPSCMPVRWRCEVCFNEWETCVDSVLNKTKSGCPKCAGNLAFTVETLQQHPNILPYSKVLELDKSSRKNDKGHRIGRYAKFKCNTCDHIWSANIYNVVKFGYGCPICNSNLSTPCESKDGIKFHSKLERYFWDRVTSEYSNVLILRQHRYCTNRRLTCDFYIPEYKMWVEVCGQHMLLREKYLLNIADKRSIVEAIQEQFITLTTIPEINQFISAIGLLLYDPH